MSQKPSCPSCSKKYAGVGGEDALLPVILACMCVICKGCALFEEAKAQQQEPAAASGGKKKKGKGKQKQEHTPTTCMNCKRMNAMPVKDLQLDIALMKRVDAGHAASAPAVPLCDICEEEKATKYCGECKRGHRLQCDGCHATSHKSVKKQGHVSVPILEHLASGPAHAAGGGAASTPPPMCRIHADEALKVFCNTCNILICAMCGILQHKTHDLTPVEQAAGLHRETIEALLAEVVVTREESIVAANAVKIIRGELKGNMEAALKVIEEGFNRILRAARQRRDELVALVNGAYHEKDDMYNKHITALEAIEDDSEAAVQLIEATLAVATPVELLERKQLFVGGLTQFKGHPVALKETCAPNLTITLRQSFAQTAGAILALGALDTDATDPAASTAAGEGLAVAVVGEAIEFVVTAAAVGSRKQRRVGGDKVEVMLVRAGAVDEGAAPSAGGGGAAAAQSDSGKRKRSGGGGASGGKGRASKKSKSGASTSVSTAAAGSVEGTAVDCGDGTYNCSYTPLAEGAAPKPEERQLEVLLNGKHIVGSPFAVEVRPAYTNWVFGSMPADNRYELSEGGAVVTQIKGGGGYKGAIADGAGCTPMTSGVHFWELERVKYDAHNGWGFGVCRPGIDLDDDDDFVEGDGTWMMWQNNNPLWRLYCNTCKGTSITLDPQPEMPEGSRIGLLLDFDNGGTLTMYLDNKPCGTIAEGLAGPLLPCISSACEGKIIKVHSGLAPPQ